MKHRHQQTSNRAATLATAGLFALVALAVLPQVALAAGDPARLATGSLAPSATDNGTARTPEAGDGMARPAIVVRPLDISALDASAFGDWESAAPAAAVADVH